MISLVNSWAQGLIIAVIICVIIEMILPEGNNKKYIKIVLSMYILFTIIYPLVNKINKQDIGLNSIIKNTNYEIKKYEANTAVIETNSYIEKTYKNKLEENIINSLKEKGYKVLDINLYLETQEEDKYGQINSIVLNIDRKNNDENISSNSINTVKINVSKNENIVQEKPIITIKEINVLKDFIENSYSIEKERIHINE